MEDHALTIEERSMQMRNKNNEVLEVGATVTIRYLQGDFTITKLEPILGEVHFKCNKTGAEASRFKNDVYIKR